MAFIDADKLSYEIFSFLESKFLFASSTAASLEKSGGFGGRIRVLSIDGGYRPSDVLVAAAALDRLESFLRLHTGEPSARVADLFDVAAGSGAGGVLAAMLFTRGHDGLPLFSAADALRLLVSESRRRRGRGFASSRGGFFRGVFRRPGGFFRRVFGDATLRDAIKPILIPCYDLATGAPFLFSRTDAVEADGFDFRMREVCAATCADSAAVEMRSVDGRTRVAAVGGGVAMANPTAAALTHVLHNKQEFPFAEGMADFLVVSLGATPTEPSPTGAADLLRIAAEGVADMVDQAVAMAFGHCRANNYIRIQANNNLMSGNCTPRLLNSTNFMRRAEDILSQRNVESFLFRGKKLSEQSNADKLDRFGIELMMEEERRKKSPIPVVVIKQAMTPRTSSATTITTTVATTATTMSPVH